MQRTILSVAYPFAAVGPDAVGGAEQVLSLLDAALVRAGHQSIVVAAGGSRPAGELIPTGVPPGRLDEPARRQVWQEHRAHIAEAVRRQKVDVIHMHGIDFEAYLPEVGGPPVLVTLHLPPGWYGAGVFELPQKRPGTFLHCVSSQQRSACPAGARLLESIPNGVPTAALDFHCTKRRYAVALGRICPEKNFHVALEAGRRAECPVLLGGAVFPHEAHQRYFSEQIEPRLDRQRRFIGPVGFARKRRLLSGARCLLHPTLAPETSSLVAMEAMACGTPVIAFASGALGEIVEQGLTGFLVRNETEMTQAIEAAGEIDPAACRRAARERFSLERMVERYFEVYERLANGECDAGR